MHWVSQFLNAGDHTQETLEGVPGAQGHVWRAAAVPLTRTPPLSRAGRGWAHTAAASSG